MKFLLYTWLIIQVTSLGTGNINFYPGNTIDGNFPTSQAQYLNPDPFLPACILPESQNYVIQHISSTISQLKTRQINPVEFFSFRKVVSTRIAFSFLRNFLVFERSQQPSVLVFPFNYFW